MIRLAINAVNLDAGGGLTGLVGYLRAWNEIGADLDIVVFASRSVVIEAVRRVRPDVRVVPFGVGLGLPRRLLAQGRELGAEIGRSGATVAMSTNMLAGRCPVPQLVHHRNLLLFRRGGFLEDPVYGTKVLVQRRFAREALRGSAANVFISRYLQEQAERAVPESAPRNRVVYNGLPEAVIDGVDRPAKWTGSPDLLAVTSDHTHKDNPTLVRTLRRLVDVRPDLGWSLSVAGTGRYASTRSLARNLGVADRIRWLGFVGADELDDWFRRSLCLLFPSRVEGFGIPPLEAMARRCPVVAGRSTAIPEVVGHAGMLANPGDADDFARAVVTLLDDRSARDAQIERGAERIRGFRWVDSASKMFDAIRDVAG